MLTAIAECGGAGLICGSIHLNDLTSDAPAFPIVVTEGFGSDAPISADARSALEQAEGRLVSIDGTTQLRVGVRRPRVVIPSGRSA